jgi:hypothetical protein
MSRAARGIVALERRTQGQDMWACIHAAAMGDLGTLSLGSSDGLSHAFKALAYLQADERALDLIGMAVPAFVAVDEDLQERADAVKARIATATARVEKLWRDLRLHSLKERQKPEVAALSTPLNPLQVLDACSGRVVTGQASAPAVFIALATVRDTRTDTGAVDAMMDEVRRIHPDPLAFRIAQRAVSLSGWSGEHCPAFNGMACEGHWRWVTQGDKLCLRLLPGNHGR